jgi:hypothetical protein
MRFHDVFDKATSSPHPRRLRGNDGFGRQRRARQLRAPEFVRCQPPAGREPGGKRLRFSSSQYQNDQIAEASQGDAVRDAGKTSATVELSKPGKKKLKLPDDIYFSMQHAETLINAAKQGKTLFNANLYDGSEKGDKYYETTTVIQQACRASVVAGFDQLFRAGQGASGFRPRL